VTARDNRRGNPDGLESSGRQRRIDRRRRDRPMTEPSLDCPGIVPLVGEDIGTGVAKHVRVRLQFEAEPFAGRPLDHSGKAGRRERRAALTHEDEGRRGTLTLLAAQRTQLIPLQRMYARRPALAART